MAGELSELIRMELTMKVTGLGRAHIDLLHREGKFPKKVKLGRATAFVRAEVEEWIEARIAERDNVQPGTKKNTAK